MHLQGNEENMRHWPTVSRTAWNKLLQYAWQAVRTRLTCKHDAKVNAVFLHCVSDLKDLMVLVQRRQRGLTTIHWKTMRILGDYKSRGTRQPQLQTIAGVRPPPGLWEPWELSYREGEAGISPQVQNSRLVFYFFSTLLSFPLLPCLHCFCGAPCWFFFFKWRHPFVSKRDCCDIANLVSICPRALINSIFNSPRRRRSEKLSHFRH